MENRDNWVIFYVYGRVGYASLSANACLSLRAVGCNFNVKLCVCEYIYSKLTEGFKAIFDKVEVIDSKDLIPPGEHKLDKCYAKLGFWKYKEGRGINIFLDADSLVLNNYHFDAIVELAERQGIVFGHVNYGRYDSNMTWGSRMTNYSQFFEIDAYTNYITAVSSYMVAFDTTISFDGVFDTYSQFKKEAASLKHKYNTWQNSIPDELIWQIHMNRIGMNKRDFKAVDGAVYMMYGNSVNYSAADSCSIMTYVGELGGFCSAFYNKKIEQYCQRLNFKTVPTYYIDKKLFSLNENIFLIRNQRIEDEYRRNNRWQFKG